LAQLLQGQRAGLRGTFTDAEVFRPLHEGGPLEFIVTWFTRLRTRFNQGFVLRPALRLSLFDLQHPGKGRFERSHAGYDEPGVLQRPDRGQQGFRFHGDFNFVTHCFPPRGLLR
jgi:hypothetical protein